MTIERFIKENYISKKELNKNYTLKSKQEAYSQRAVYILEKSKDLNFSQIGRELGITRERVRQIYKEIMDANQHVKVDREYWRILKTVCKALGITNAQIAKGVGAAEITVKSILEADKKFVGRDITYRAPTET